MTIAGDLAKWAISLKSGEIPVEVSHAAQRHLLDGVGNAIAALRIGVVAPAVDVADALGGPPEATRLGAPRQIGAPAAAMANGTLVHGLDFDDTHAGGLVHATAVVLPAAFAVGEQVSASGAEVLTAAVVGYETVCRIAAASPHGFHARGLHATAIAGVFASALVTACLLKTDHNTATNALGIAGSSAAGLLEFLSTGASTKQLHAGSASMNGIIAARLAIAGATGPSTVFEGPNGIYAALSARESDPTSVTRDFATRWETTQITIKPYPSCQLMHVTLDAVAAALEGARIDPASIVEIVADVHPDSADIVCEPAEVKINPRSSYDAKFSLPWSTAALLIDGSIGIDTYSASSIARPDVAALAARVRTEVVAADAVAADAPGRVSILLADGRELAGRVARSFGGPDFPLSDAALMNKFFLNVDRDDTLSQELAMRVFNLPNEKSLDRIVELAALVADGD